MILVNRFNEGFLPFDDIINFSIVLRLDKIYDPVFFATYKMFFGGFLLSFILWIFIVPPFYLLILILDYFFGFRFHIDPHLFEFFYLPTWHVIILIIVVFGVIFLRILGLLKF